MKDERGSGISVGEQGGEKKENRKSIPLAEILAAVKNREDLTEEEKQAFRTLYPKILETAERLAVPAPRLDKNEQKEETKEVFDIQSMLDKIERIYNDPALEVDDASAKYENANPEMAKLDFSVFGCLDEVIRYLKSQLKKGRKQFLDGSAHIDDNIQLIMNLDPLTRIKGLPESVMIAIGRDIKPLLKKLLDEVNNNPEKRIGGQLKVLYPSQDGMFNEKTMYGAGIVPDKESFGRTGKIATCYSPAIVTTDQDDPDLTRSIYQSQVTVWE